MRLKNLKRIMTIPWKECSREKQFLVGLSIQNLIDESRLFLPEEVREFIELKRPNLDTSFIAETFGHGTTCIIYMRLVHFTLLKEVTTGMA